MQVLFESGQEHGVTTAGLGQWPGEVTQLDAPVLPHMGWNTVEVANGSTLFAGVEEERFYFVHSYAARQWQLRQEGSLPATKVAWANYGGRFLAAVENGPLTATQFHPEKSGDAGARLIANWMKTL
jgi:glutamine amidotransferase